MDFDALRDEFLSHVTDVKSITARIGYHFLRWSDNDAHELLLLMFRFVNFFQRRNLTPAVMAYEGIQYCYMAPGVMETSHLDYLREHLRILSGFYGLLRPFDGVTPYRLCDITFRQPTYYLAPGHLALGPLLNDLAVLPLSKRAGDKPDRFGQMGFHRLAVLLGGQIQHAIASLNIERLRRMDLRRNLTPAVMAYEGMV